MSNRLDESNKFQTIILTVFPHVYFHYTFSNKQSVSITVRLSNLNYYLIRIDGYYKQICVRYKQFVQLQPFFNRISLINDKLIK